MSASIIAPAMRAVRSPLARGIAMTFGARLFGAVLAMVSSIITARTLGPEGRGIFAAVTALAAIGLQLSTLGLQSSNTYYVSVDRDLLKPILANAALVTIVVGGLVSAVLWFYATATGLDASVGSVPLAWALAAIPASLGYMLYSSLLVPLGRIRRLNAIETGYKVAALGLVTAAVLLGFRSPEAFLAASLLASALALLASGASVGFTPAVVLASSPSLLLRQFPYALRAFLASFLAFLLVRIDMLMVQAISGNAEAGHYAIAVAMADMIYMLPAAAAALLFPRLVESKDIAIRRSLTLRILAGVGAATGALALAGAVLAEWAVVLLYGPDFASAASMFRVLAVAIALYGANNVVSNFFAAQGFTWGAVWVWALGVIVNVLLNLALIPSMGGIGAAWASVAGYGVVLAVQLAMMAQMNGAGR